MSLAGFSSGSVVKSLLIKAGDVAQSLGWEIPWRRKWQPSPVFLPGESHRLRKLAGYSAQGHELDTTEATAQHIVKNSLFMS